MDIHTRKGFTYLHIILDALFKKLTVIIYCLTKTAKLMVETEYKSYSLILLAKERD